MCTFLMTMNSSVVKVRSVDWPATKITIAWTTSDYCNHSVQITVIGLAIKLLCSFQI